MVPLHIYPSYTLFIYNIFFTIFNLHKIIRWSTPASVFLIIIYSPGGVNHTHQAERDGSYGVRKRGVFGGRERGKNGGI